MTIKFKLITLFLISTVISVYAAPIKFYSINSIYGISIRGTSSVCKDNNGFIWVSSITGVVRLSDDDYRIYQLPYETADVLLVKLIYKNSKLIAYTNNGQVFFYDPVYDRFELIINLSKVLEDKHLIINKILMDDFNNYWIASSNGLYTYKSYELSLIDTFSIKNYSVAMYDKQNIILAGFDGIRLYNVLSCEKKELYTNTTFAPFLVSSLYCDKKQGKLWIGTLASGLFSYDFESNTITSILKAYFPRQPVLDIEEYTDSSLIIGVDGQGIWELGREGDKVLNIFKENVDDPYSLPGNGVYDIFCDEGKRVWICTISGGVSFFDEVSPLVKQVVHHTNNINSLVNNNVNAIIEDRAGKLWFATNNGISCWDISSDQWSNYYCDKMEQAQVFISLCEDDYGRIWAGSYSSGTYVLNENDGRELAHYSKNEMDSTQVSNFILDIFKDSQGDIWVGGVNGEFICYQSKSNKIRTYSVEPISSFAELSSGQILLGCSYGLSLLNKESGKMKTLLLGFLVNDILKLDEEIWIGTTGDGLLEYNYKTGEVEKYTTQSGLPSNFINSIVYTDGYLWVGTENGICRFNPKTKNTQTFSSIIPLSRISYNYRANFKMKSGQLAWGTSNGAVIFDPQSIGEIPYKGKIFIQDLKISGRSIREIPTFKLNTPVNSLQVINLKYFQNNISVELLPLGLPSGSKFIWKMEGLDRDWVPPSDNRIITYTNIPSGRFLLKIKLYDSSLSHVIAERSITIRLTPPFWRKGWFLVLLFTVALGILFLSLLFYIKSLKQKHTEEKVRFFTDTAHDIRTSITLIKAPVEELTKETSLSESGQYYLNLAQEQTKRLNSVVTQLMDFQKVDIGKGQMTLSMENIVMLVSNRILMFETFAKSKDIKLIFTCKHQNYFTAVDAPKIEKIIDNLISNSVKYSYPGGLVKIDLQCNDKNWELWVKDQGIGISRKAQRQLFKEFYRGDNAMNSKIVGSGIGLLLVKKYVTMHGGNIFYNSQENVGTTFHVVVPFKEVSSDLKMLETPSSPEIFENVQVYSDLRENTGRFAVHMKEMKVLIVDDNEDLLHFLYHTLKKDFKVYTEEDGAKAWEFILEQMPDLIVSDIMMPNMDGFELCQLVKSTYETSHIPIILLTALSQKAEQLQGLGYGADDYLTKPFNMALLSQKIKTTIRNREVVREKTLKLLNKPTIGPLLANEHNDKFVKRMMDVAKANISNLGFNKDEFASEMNVSPSLLYKKIKSLTDQSPVEFMKTIRLEHALELLQTQKYSITEVSELCGFTSVGYFSTVFRKYYGVPPTKTKQLDASRLKRDG
jgi:signal transduction histidine kinase/ligand-binding sensor domain-containing protein/AraC-like DNA-binding protein